MTEKEKQERVNVSIDHSEPAFFSDSIVVSHTPEKFVVDFSQTSPRFDTIGGNFQHSLTVKHKTILVDPRVAKDFLNILGENIERYEKKFGKIQMPKRQRSKSAKAEKIVSDASRYIG